MRPSLRFALGVLRLATFVLGDLGGALIDKATGHSKAFEAAVRKDRIDRANGL